jgi:RNA polymerase sigma factor (sigma-70 family)
MRQRPSEPALDAEVLQQIERSLHGKLRAHRLSEGFIGRNSEDALQQGLAEYVIALERGSRIENPGGWIVNTAFRRALNQLRREARSGSGDAAELAAVRGEGGRSPVEEEAIEHAQAEQLRKAIGSLAPEQRQALGLYFFEERTTREAADLLGCGETTFRRRRDSALKTLRERFGVPTPERGDDFALRIGLVAWLSLAGGARVPVTRGPLDQALAIAEQVRGAVGGLFSRGRDLLSSLLTSGGGEGIGAAASGPLGKAAGACAGALAACALTGVIGPGVGGVDLIGGSGHSPPSSRRHTAVGPPPPSATTSGSRGSSGSASGESAGNAGTPPRRAGSRAGGGRARQSRQAERTASSQFGVESAGGSAPVEPAPQPTAPATPNAGAAPKPSPTEVANEQFAP